MSRTPEQEKADQAVTHALEEWLRVYELDGSAEDDGVPRVLTDYVVLMATQGWMPDGDSITGHPYILGDVGMPIYRALGLIQIHGVLLKSLILENDDEGKPE